ncbi:unnamed protein product [Diamesa hyperborea]
MDSEDDDDETEDAQSTSESTSKIANPSPIIIPVPMPVPIPIPLSMPVYTTNTDYNVTSLIRQQPPANATNVSSNDLPLIDCSNNNNNGSNNTLTIRRARLKSISLDSDASSNRNFTYCRKLGSFEENSPADTVTTTTTTQAQLSSNSSTMSYKSNLTASIQQLNVSNSNLKTLPEIMSISDFDGPKPTTRVAPMGLPPSKSGILQRRGSNHSLTLNLDGSCGNLSHEDQKELLIKLHQEFWNLPTNYQEKPMVFGSQSKNRYKTILPNEHSRVILQREDGFLQEPYINANFIKGPDYTNDTYIATQGPMQNTIYEFWLMIHQNITKADEGGIQKIAMLTDFIESQRQKCAVYFPVVEGDFLIFTNTGFECDEIFVRDNLEMLIGDNCTPDDEDCSSEKKSFNFFVIKNVALHSKNGYSIRKLQMYYGNSLRQLRVQCFNVYHYWFPDWPDHRSPQDIDVLLDMSLDLLDGNCARDFDENADEEMLVSVKSPLPVLHCSAGIGRTGCLAAILNGLGQIRANTTTLNSDNTTPSSVDVLGIVCNLRLQRGGMVQNSEQYELIHRSLCLYQHKVISPK